jgi:hypothetical protein
MKSIFGIHFNNIVFGTGNLFAANFCKDKNLSLANSLAWFSFIT